jgi:hypothetical protein
MEPEKYQKVLNQCPLRPSERQPGLFSPLEIARRLAIFAYHWKRWGANIPQEHADRDQNWCLEHPGLRLFGSKPYCFICR